MSCRRVARFATLWLALLAFGGVLGYAQVPKPWLEAGSDPGDYQMGWDAKRHAGVLPAQAPHAGIPRDRNGVQHFRH